MKFSDFVCFDATVSQLNAVDRNSAITELVDSLDKAKKLGTAKAKTIAAAVIEREVEASTGMGKGVAIPHVKHRAVKDVVAAIGQCPAGIDFSSLDKQPVHTVILLVSPASFPEKHLQAMEKIFKHLQGEKFRKFLRQSQTIEEIEDLLREADENASL